MRLFEFQGKDLLRKYGLPLPRSILAKTPEEAAGAFRKLQVPVVVKAQVLAGGRGKAGGILAAKDERETVDAAKKILSLNVAGEKPRWLLVEEAYEHKEEMYLSVALDRGERCFVVIVSTAGGIEVESLTGKTVQRIPLAGLDSKSSEEIASRAGIPPSQTAQFVSVLMRLEQLAREDECELAEVNPLAVGRDGSLMALDAKVILDDNALFRHPEFSKLQPEDELEGEASRQGFAFVRLDGNIAVVGNGAGLVLSTLDLVADAGGSPACFLDLGGGAQRERVEAAIRLVNRLPNVERILVNIFGGITRTTDVAEGVQAVLSSESVKPLFARISGAEEEAAKKLLADSPVRLFRTVPEAVQAVVGTGSV